MQPLSIEAVADDQGAAKGAGGKGGAGKGAGGKGAGGKGPARVRLCGQEVAYLRKRTGFVRMALEEGVDLVGVAWTLCIRHVLLCTHMSTHILSHTITHTLEIITKTPPPRSHAFPLAKLRCLGFGAPLWTPLASFPALGGRRWHGAWAFCPC